MPDAPLRGGDALPVCEAAGNRIARADGRADTQVGFRAEIHGEAPALDVGKLSGVMHDFEHMHPGRELGRTASNIALL